MSTEPNFPPEPASFLTKMSYDILGRIALNTIPASSNPPAPHELRTICSLLLVSRKLRDTISIRNNHDLYATIFRLMFDINAVQRRLGSPSALQDVLTTELIKRLKLLRRIKAHSEEASYNTSILQEDNTAVFFMVLENEGKNMRQLQTAGVGRFLHMIVTRTLESTTTLFKYPYVLVFPLVWSTRSSEAVIQGMPQRRDDILNFIQCFVLEDHLDTRENGPPRTLLQYFSIELTFTPPNLIPFARLCSATLFHSVNPALAQNANNSWDLHRYDDDWRRFTSINTPQNGRGAQAPQFPPYTAGTFSGTWKGSYFIPSKINGIDVEKTETYEVVTKCRLREFHSCTEEESVAWHDPGDSGDALAQAWFPVDIEYYKTDDSLMVYDPAKSRWLRYQGHARPITNDPTVIDTIIVGASSDNDYTFHGRIRRQDGWVALVRTPTQPTDHFLGTWVFHGQVHGATDFVGDWRCAASTKVAPGQQGWFSWSKWLE